MRTLARIRELILESTDLIVPRNTLGIPRHQMPQISSKDYPEFFHLLKLRGIQVDRGRFPAKDLRAAQKEIDHNKVREWTKSLPENAKNKPCIISNDFYVLDGNHTWLALLNKDPNCFIDCYRINQDMMALLDTIKLFDRVTYKTVNEQMEIYKYLKRD